MRRVGAPALPWQYGIFLRRPDGMLISALQSRASDHEARILALVCSGKSHLIRIDEPGGGHGAS